MTTDRTLEGTRDEPRTQDDDAVPGVLVVFSAGRFLRAAVVIPPTGLVIGRDAIGSLLIADPRISRRHAELAWAGGRFVVRDAGSRNGTAIDGSRVSGELAFDGARVVRMGDTLMLPRADVRPWLEPELGDDPAVGPTLAARIVEAARVAIAHGRLHLEAEIGVDLRPLVAAFAGGETPSRFDATALPDAAAVAERFRAARGSVWIDGLAALAPGASAALLAELVRADGVAGGTRVVTSDVPGARFPAPLAARLGPRLTIPALRERADEVAGRARTALAGTPVHASFVDALLQRVWPGNDDELHRAVVAAASAAGPGQEVRARHLDPRAGLHALSPDPVHAPQAVEGVALSPRECEALAHLLDGRSDKEIAVALNLSPHTAHQYVKALFKKLGVHSRTELQARYARS